MTPEAQRIAIAEACGWYWTGSCYALSFDEDGKRVHMHESAMPDYPSDLNAMHEAEKVLTSRQCERYFGLLATAPYNREAGLGASAWQAHATAAQRAEAFLRTIGKWVDSPSGNHPT